MQTTGLWIYPRTDSNQQVVGYSVSCAVHVRVRDLSRANAKLGGVVHFTARRPAYEQPDGARSEAARQPHPRDVD